MKEFIAAAKSAISSHEGGPVMAQFLYQVMLLEDEANIHINSLCETLLKQGRIS
jgi:hypothetical protein